MKITGEVQNLTPMIIIILYRILVFLIQMASTFNNNNGPALEVFSDYGKTLAYDIQEIETTSFNDTIIGRDNFAEDIRLFTGQ